MNICRIKNQIQNKGLNTKCLIKPRRVSEILIAIKYSKDGI